MSYILEALKKADAERDRGAVPDLHAQGMLPEAAFEGDPAGRSRPWLWLLAGVGLALIVGVAWWWMGSGAPAGETVAATAPPVAMPAAPVAAASMATPPSTVPPAGGDGASGLGQDAVREAAPARVPAKAAGSTPAGAPKDAPGTGESAQPGAAIARPRKDVPKVPSEPRAAMTPKDDAKPEAALASPAVKASSPPAAAERVPRLPDSPTMCGGRCRRSSSAASSIPLRPRAAW